MLFLQSMGAEIIYADREGTTQMGLVQPGEVLCVRSVDATNNRYELANSENGKWLFPRSPLKELPHRSVESKNRPALSTRNHVNATQSSNAHMDRQPCDKEPMRSASNSKPTSLERATTTAVRSTCGYTSRNTGSSSKAKNSASRRNGVTGNRASNDERWLERLTTFYQKYCPSKLPAVPKILAQFRGRELELWAKVQEKYLPAVIGNRRHNIGEAAAAIESARVRGAAAMQIDKYADEKVESKEAESINPLLRSHQHHSEVAADRNDSTTPPSLKAVAAGEATTTAATNTNTAIEAAAEVAANAPVLKRSDDATTTRNTTGSSSSSSSCYGNGVQMSSCGRQRSVASKLAADAAESRWKAMANAAGTNACGAGSTGAGAASASASAGAAATCAAGAGAGDGAGAAVALVNVASDCTGSAGTAAAPANTPDMHALAAVNDDNGVVKRNAACVTDTTAIAASYSTAMMTPAAAAASAVLAHLPADQRTRMLERGAREGRVLSANTLYRREGNDNDNGNGNGMRLGAANRCLARSGRAVEEGRDLSEGRLCPSGTNSSSSRVGRSRSASGSSRRRERGKGDGGSTCRRAPLASSSSGVAPLHDAWSSLSLGGAAAASAMGGHDRDRHRDWTRRAGGTGPSIGNVIEVSERACDEHLVASAAAGNLEAVKDAITAGAEVNAAVRPRMISSSNRDGGSSSSSGSSSNAHGSSQERREMQRQRKQPAKGRAATALIAAAATAGANAGANATGRGGERNGARTADGIGSFSSTATSGLEVLEFLLASGADPNLDLGWLRALPPLHHAATPQAALLLLRYGARSAPSDNPREPPPIWYHKQRQRPEVAACIKAWRAAHNQPASWQLNGGGGATGAGYSSGYAFGAGGGGTFLLSGGGAVTANGDGGDGSDVRLVFPGLSVQSIRVALQRFRCAPVSSKKTKDKEPKSAALTCAQGLDSGATGLGENGSNRRTTTVRAKDQAEDEENYADEEGEGKGGEPGEGDEDEDTYVLAVEEECPICLEELSSDPPLNLGGAAQDQKSSGSSSSSGFGAKHGTVTLEELLVGKGHGNGSSSGTSRKEGDGNLRGVILATPCGGCEGTHEGSNSIAGGGSAGGSSGTGDSQVVNNTSGGAFGCHGRRHAFHALCLCDWLRRSCRCPLCKTDLRPFLREE